jgi:hypothetical protein
MADVAAMLQRLCPSPFPIVLNSESINSVNRLTARWIAEFANHQTRRSHAQIFALFFLNAGFTLTGSRGACLIWRARTWNASV